MSQADWRNQESGRPRFGGPEAEYFGWDITSFDDDGNEIFIEVKSSVGKVVSNVNLTVNEWNAAREMARRDHYYIYIVTDALSAAPQIERLRNPASYIDTRQLDCEPILYELQLQQRSGLLTGSDAPTIVRVEAFAVDGMQQLDLEFLGGQAKAIALDVAADSQLYLAPEALAAIDGMIAERKDVIQQTWRDLETWKAHVRHISIVTAKMYKSRNVKSIKDPNELIETARSVYRIYPYD